MRSAGGLRSVIGAVSQSPGPRPRYRDSMVLAAAEVFAGLPPARQDGAALLASIRAMRAADGMLDDDPTGSQAVHGVQVVTVLDDDVYPAALGGAARTCFVLTNSRSVGERDAARLTTRAARGLVAAARRLGAPIDLVSRSDSTLRGHVLAEVAALAAVRREATGRAVDAVLLVPAFIEAGRLTAADIHWARTPSGLVPVGETEFARDPVFGYAASDLRAFVAEKSGGAIGRDGIASIGLADIRTGGPSRVRELLAGLHDGTWVVVNAVEYSDLETVACGVRAAERAGKSFLFRTGPSFVRALAGLEPKPPLRGEQLVAGPGRGQHGLIVVGSHVAQTSRQVADLRARGGTAGVELDVPAVIGGTSDVVAAAARRVTDALGRSDVLLYTSRAFVAGGGADPLAAARARIVRQALAARPAWIIAKGGITSHDVATRGLGIRRAVVTGQILPGLVSVFRPVDAAPEAMGMPYVVFPGNVGDDQALAQVAAILTDGHRAH